MLNHDSINKKNIVIISLVLFDCNGAGHNYEYVRAVRDATTIINWQHYAALPSNIEVSLLQEKWTACLTGVRKLENTNIGLLPKIVKLALNSFKLSMSIYKYLNNIQQEFSNNTSIILFIDSFKPSELFAFTISLLFSPNTKLIVWLLYRHDDYQKFSLIYKTLNLAIEKKINKDSLKILTDSEKLKYSLKQVFNKEVYLLPIPHTEKINTIHFVRSPSNANDSSILMWWPGNPNQEKGLNIIKGITLRKESSIQNFHLFLSEQVNLTSINPQLKIIHLPAYLTRHEYLEQLSKVHFIILPYDPQIYGERTSGIFVEAICAGKIPLVSWGTWMASELEKFELQDLIIDWEKAELFRLFSIIYQDEKVRQKIKIMSNYYLNFHSIKSYAEHLQKNLQLST